MKTLMIAVVLMAVLFRLGESVFCYRCQYVTADDEQAQEIVDSALGGTSNIQCEMDPESNFSPMNCSDADASCGTVRARLDMNTEFNGQKQKVKVTVFSRDCFPDVTNPGVEADDVEDGCHKADDFETFFDSRFVQGLASVSSGFQAELQSQTGCICFCSDDGCNNRTESSVASEEKCEFGTSATSAVYVPATLLLLGLIAAQFRG